MRLLVQAGFSSASQMSASKAKRTRYHKVDVSARNTSREELRRHNDRLLMTRERYFWFVSRLAGKRFAGFINGESSAAF